MTGTHHPYPQPASWKVRIKKFFARDIGGHKADTIFLVVFALAALATPIVLWCITRQGWGAVGLGVSLAGLFISLLSQRLLKDRPVVAHYIGLGVGTLGCAVTIASLAIPGW